MDELESILWKAKRTTDYSYRKRCSQLNKTKEFRRKNTSSFDETFLPSITMMTLKHRETKNSLHYYGDGNHGNQTSRNKGHGNIHYDESGNYGNQISRNMGHGAIHYDESGNYGNKIYGNVDHDRTYLGNRNYGNNSYDKMVADVQRNDKDIKYDNVNRIDSKRPAIGIKGEGFLTDERDMVVKYRLERQCKPSLMNDDDTSCRTTSRLRTKRASRELNERLVKRGVAQPSPPLMKNCIPREEREGQRFRPSDVHERYKTLTQCSNTTRCCTVDAASKPGTNGEQTKRYVHVYLCCCKDSY